MNNANKSKALIISALLSALLTALVTVSAKVVLRNIAVLTRAYVGSDAITSALMQLKGANIRVGIPLILIFFALIFAALSLLFFRRRLKVVAVIVIALLLLGFFVIDLMLARVNGVPVHTALNVIKSILDSGVL